MSRGCQTKNRLGFNVASLSLLSFLLVLAVLHGCGRQDEEGQSSAAQAPVEEGMTRVKGAVPFASQCPYGMFSQPVNTPLSLWDCRLGLPEVELEQLLQSVTIQADCKKKLIAVRSLDGKHDSLWEVMPDNSFYFSIDGGMAYLRNDGAGNAGCETPLSVEMFGKLDCQDRDRVTIDIETVWWLDRKTPPTPTPSALPTSPPGPVPSSAPSATPSAGPGPAASPRPTVSSSPVPIPQPSSPNPRTIVTMRRSPFAAASAAPARPACKIPPGCYFYATTKIKQCE